ncbi:Abi family protein [Desulfoprunum sp.]|uniref:Abi family protein n=1 Tax=Desulfoprunum sp. TaxID=2020866 RepID=UPI003C7837BC
MDRPGRADEDPGGFQTRSGDPGPVGHRRRRRGYQPPSGSPTDRQRAVRYLCHISYFRLRGYWIPLESAGPSPGHRFRPGTTFNDVTNLYIFDRKFRLLMLEAIERVEI